MGQIINFMNKIFIRQRNDDGDSTIRHMLRQICGLTTGKAWLPTVDSLTEGTI